MKVRTFFSVMYFVLLVGFYLMTFFVTGNKIALVINYMLMLLLVSMLISAFILRKYQTNKMKAVTGMIVLVLMVLIALSTLFV